MPSLFRHHLRWTGLVLCAAIGIAACRSSTAPERHVRPSGVVVLADGAEVVRAVSGSTPTGSFTVAEGGQSPLLTVTFLDAQGNEITPPEDYHLELRFANPAIASFVADDTPYTFRGRIQGLQAGTTTVQMRFMHGPPGHVATHAEFTSAAIQVLVE